MKLKLLLALLLISFLSQSQIKGKITDTYGTPIPYVSILIENTYIGTSSNDNGDYQLDIAKKGVYKLVVKSLGFKTTILPIEVNSFPFVQNVTLEVQSYVMEEIVITSRENPAYGIIRNAIKNKKINTDKTDKFTADFYSKGIFKVKDIPEKIFGQKIDLEDMGTGLDSTGSGILYLSETISKITVQKPGKLKEHIVASKVSGDDKGFSFNTAQGTDLDFYNNYVEFGSMMISPIADNAFAYYKYRLESTFTDENDQLINKIEVIAKRDKEPVFEGYIYIVEDSWAIYAVELNIKGYRMNQPFIDNLDLVQNYGYNSENDKWTKNLQTFNFSAGFFGIKFNGKFTHVFSNYTFVDSFEKRTFTKEIISFDKEANKKDTNYWNDIRPVPLNEEEFTDYIKKDSIQTLRKSQVYMDSLDLKNNKFKIEDILLGYTYKNSFKKWRLSYDGISDLMSTTYNTVQGWNFNSGFRFSTENEDKGTYTSVGSKFNYGLADDRLRVTGYIGHQFNRQNYATVNLSGGSKVSQFNESEPISPFINMISTLFFKDNYIKLYNKEFVKLAYGQEVVNGLYMSGELEYANRKALFNTTDYVLLNQDKEYLSNNPLDPNDDSYAAFEPNHIYKLNLGMRIRFGQEYISRPDAKWNMPNEDYPILYLGYQKGFAASESGLNHDLLMARATHNKTFGNKGTMGANIKAGKFLGADDISFIDYKHFNGNQTHVGTSGWYLNQFHLLPYYSHSTNDSYLEMHFEHHFKGFVMNKVPLLNKLQWHLNLGYHNIAIPDRKPYNEFSAGFGNIGFGKFRMFRVDYARSYNGSAYATDGFMFGLSILNML